MDHDRRGLLLGGLAGLAAAALGGGRPARAALLTHPDALVFDVTRSGGVIGRHVLRFTEADGRLTVDIAIRIKVSLASIVLFRYVHDSREVWQDGRLLSLDTRTNDDGEPFQVTARAVGDQLHVEGSGGRLTLPAGTKTTGWWNRRLIGGAPLLDSQRGRVADLHFGAPVAEPIDVAGATVDAERYDVTGDYDMALWYLPNDEWGKLVFHAKGAPVVYARQGADGAPAETKP